MTRSLLRAGNVVSVVLIALVLSLPHVSYAQDKRPMRANQKTIVEPEKKAEHNRHAAIKYRRGDDKRRRDVKAKMNKEKAEK